MLFQAESMISTKPSQSKLNTRKSSDQNGSSVLATNLNSLRSLRRPRNSSSVIKKVDSNMSLTVRPMPSEMNTKSPSQAQLGFGMMIKD